MAVVDGCCVVLTGGAGQGAHREVGSEGFEAKHRAVAEDGEPVGPIQVMPSPHYRGEGSTGETLDGERCQRHAFTVNTAWSTFCN